MSKQVPNELDQYVRSDRDESEVRDVLSAVQLALKKGHRPEFDYETSEYGVYVDDDWPLEVPEDTGLDYEPTNDSIQTAMSVHAYWAEANLDDIGPTERGDAHFLVYFK